MSHFKAEGFTELAGLHNCYIPNGGQCSEASQFLDEKMNCYAQYTPPTWLNCRVESRRRCVFETSWRQSRRVWTNLPAAKSSCIVSAVWTHPSAVVTQFTIFYAVELLRLVTIKVTTVTSLLKKLSISIKIHVVKPLWSLFGQFPNCRPNP